MKKSNQPLLWAARCRALYGICGITVILLILAGCQPKAPVIYSIYPQIGNMGEPVTIRGAFFGNDREGSFITIAGSWPTSMSYLDWRDDEIRLRIPEFGEAGLVHVHVKGRKSNGVLFTNQATLPKQIQGIETGLGPRIATVTPQSGSIGSPITITGTGFGNSRGSSGVYFPWSAQMSASAPAEAWVQEFAEVSEADFGYELWNDREIRVRVPDGATGGNIEIRTARGDSSPVFFDLAGRPGTKTFLGKRSYTIAFSVALRVGEAEKTNTMYLWVPRPVVSSAQRDMELLFSNIEPFVDGYRGTSLFKLDNLAANSEARVSLSWKIDVYGVETAVLPQSIRQLANSPVSAAYTQHSPQFPAADPRIKNQAQAILGRERNPYIKAQRIYQWFLGNDMVWETQVGGDIFSVMETKQVDPYFATLLYCTLLRSEGIPCIPVAGVLVDRNQQTMHHYWVEFWIDGFGWIPVDPAMGAGAVPPSFNTNPNRASYYFGNIDNQRIAFSRGFTGLSPMDSRSRTVTRGRSYSLQNLWEEVVGIDYYTSLWGDIIITGMYVQ
jgi:transglutaminase-like putative cysteine protease